MSLKNLSKSEGVSLQARGRLFLTLLLLAYESTKQKLYTTFYGEPLNCLILNFWPILIKFIILEAPKLLWKRLCSCLKKLEIKLPNDSAMLFPGIYPEKMKTHI